MTRQYGASRTSTRRFTQVPRPARDPSIRRLGFTCFRLYATFNSDPREPAYTAIALHQTRNAMGVFALRR